MIARNDAINKSDYLGLATDYSDATADLTHTYDRRGRLGSVTEGGSVTTSRGYHDSGLMLNENYTGGSLDNWSFTNLFDTVLRDNGFRLYLSGTLKIQHSFVYDAASRLAQAGQGDFSGYYSYYPTSSVIRQIDYKWLTTNKLSSVHVRDNLNRLLAISNTPAADLEVDFAYAYNSANQRTGATNADSSRWAYTYDSLGQVTSGKRYWSDGTNVAGQQFEYLFDDIGNRLSASSGGDQTGANLRVHSYTANNLNQYSQRTAPGYVDVFGTATNASTVTVNQQSTYRHGDYYRAELSVDNSAAALWVGVTNVAVITNSGPDIVTTNIGNVFKPKTPEAFAYDADGNLTNDGRWAYTWDAENRLLTMTALPAIPTGARKAVVFTYDFQGRRVTKTVSNSTGSGWTLVLQRKFVYDGWNLIVELDNSNGMVRQYLWGTDLSGTRRGAGGVGGLVKVYDVNSNMHFYPGYDGNGNVTVLVDAATGNSWANYEYGPFGELLRATGLMGKLNPFRFSTKYQDDEGELIYYGYRYYNPSTGRWLNRDPIGEEGHRLRFANNENNRRSRVLEAQSVRLSGLPRRYKSVDQSDFRPPEEYLFCANSSLTFF